MSTRYTPAIYTDNATLYCAEGFRVMSGINIESDRDGVLVGNTLHHWDDVEVGDRRITSVIADWYVTW